MIWEAMNGGGTAARPYLRAAHFTALQLLESCLLPPSLKLLLLGCKSGSALQFANLSPLFALLVD
jgi:hypothetical protein